MTTSLVSSQGSMGLSGQGLYMGAWEYFEKWDTCGATWFPPYQTQLTSPLREEVPQPCHKLVSSKTLTKCSTMLGTESVLSE